MSIRTSVAPSSIKDHVSSERRIRPSSCSSIEAGTLPDHRGKEFVSGRTCRCRALSIRCEACIACRRRSEPRDMVVSAVSRELRSSTRNVTSPLRLGSQRSLSCFYRRRNPGPSAARRRQPSPGIRTCSGELACDDPSACLGLPFVVHSCATPARSAARVRSLALEIESQRELNFARGPRSYRRHWRNGHVYRTGDVREC